MDFGFWDETIVLWQEQGLPPDVDPSDFFGADPQWITAPVNAGLCPAFEYTVIEDHGDTELVRDEDGVLKERGKFMGSIPRHIGHTLTDRRSWEREFLPRLDPTSPRRYPPDWAERVKQYTDPARDYPLGLDCGSLYGWLRNWMGMENLSMLVYDDRALFEEMVETVADCIIASITPALESGIRFDYASFWEDMCYRGGPLLSPKVFAEVLVPHYHRITTVLRRYGVDVSVLDCDGEITHLLPLWLVGGINCMFPIEVGVWGADPVALRQTYGKDLLMIGGISKVKLAGPTDAIRAEVERLAPLVEEGGYIPLPDHRVPPDVSLKNYAFYVDEARRVWGKGLPNMRPVSRIP
jgi:uroporphyrinogen decarboxylase